MYNVVVNKCGKNIEVWKCHNNKGKVEKAWYRVGTFNEKTKEGVIIRPSYRTRNYKSLKGFIEGIEMEYGKGNWNHPFDYNWKDIDDMQRFLNETVISKQQWNKQPC